jgi:hypothetical protein
MTYIPSLHKFQIGVEAAYGDGAAATIQMPGIETVKITPRVMAERLLDKRGTTMPAHESIVSRRFSEVEVSGLLNYEYAYLWLDGMFGFATPAANDRTWKASLDWDPEVEQSLALYYGQTGLIYKVAGYLPQELTLKGDSNGPVMFTSKGFGQPAVDGASFAVLSDATPVWTMGHHCAIALDAGLAAAPGTTPLTDLAFRFEARILANRNPVWHLGNQAPDAWSRGKWDGSMRLVIEANASMLGYIGDVLDNTINPEGFVARITATDATRITTLDFAGQVLTPPDLIADEDGIVTFDVTMLPAYGSNAGLLSCWAATSTLP